MKKLFTTFLGLCLSLLCFGPTGCVTVEKAEVQFDEKKLVEEITRPETLRRLLEALDSTEKTENNHGTTGLKSKIKRNAQIKETIKNKIQDNADFDAMFAAFCLKEFAPKVRNGTASNVELSAYGAVMCQGAFSKHGGGTKDSWKGEIDFVEGLACLMIASQNGDATSTKILEEFTIKADDPQEQKKVEELFVKYFESAKVLAKKMADNNPQWTKKSQTDD